MGKRIRAQRKGSSPRYRVASHRFPGANRMPRESGVVGEVTELVHSQVHTAPLARVKLPDGDTTLVVATEGISVGSNVAIGDNVSLRPGNITSLGNIPEGTAINNLELRPGDGGKIARSAGNSCIVESRIGEKVRVRLPSGSLKELPANCRATIGVLAGHVHAWYRYQHGSCVHHEHVVGHHLDQVARRLLGPCELHRHG